MQECNSVEAIKNAVKCNLGVAFVSKLAVQQEVETGQLHALTVKGIPLTRSLCCVADPVRYQSRAVRALVNQMFGQVAESPKELPAPLQQQASIWKLDMLIAFFCSAISAGCCLYAVMIVNTFRSYRLQAICLKRSSTPPPAKLSLSMHVGHCVCHQPATAIVLTLP